MEFGYEVSHTRQVRRGRELVSDLPKDICYSMQQHAE